MLRLKEGFDLNLVESRLGITELSSIAVSQLAGTRVVDMGEGRIAPTPLGYQHLDAVIAEFI